MCHRVIQHHRLGVSLGRFCHPVHKVLGLVGLGPAFCVAVDIRQQRAGGAVPQVRDLFAKRLNLVIGQPFGEFVAADFKLSLPDAFA